MGLLNFTRSIVIELDLALPSIEPISIQSHHTRFHSDCSSPLLKGRLTLNGIDLELNQDELG